MLETLAMTARTLRVAAVMVSVLLLGLVAAANGFGETRLLAADANIVVAQDGSGTFEDISAAIEAAEDGDVVTVRPGRYLGGITLDKDITLTGDGPIEAILIAPGIELVPLVSILDSDAVLSHLTLTGEDSFVNVVGGSPTLEDLVFDRVGTAFGGDEACHALYGPSSCNPVAVRLDMTTALLRGNTFLGSGEIWVHGELAPVIEGNEIVGSHIFLESIGDGTVVRGNAIRDAEHAGIAIYTTGRPLIEGNLISGAGGAGIEVGLQLAPGIAPLIRGNTLKDNATGIEVASGAEPTIEDNDFITNSSAIVLAGSDAIISGNRFDSNASAIFVMRGAPTIRDNSISNGKVGLGLGSEDAVPILSGNTICGNGTNLNLTFGAPMPETAGNEICPDEDHG